MVKKKKIKKLTYKQWSSLIIDNTYDIFEKTPEKYHASLGIGLMSQAMNNLYLEGFCQHQIVDMVIDGVEEFIDMEKYAAKEDKRESFPFDCSCSNKRPSFMEAMKPLSKKLH